jgi:hypothetical protein
MVKSKAENSKSKSLGKEIYDDSAKFGRIMAMISAIIGTIIGISLIVGGIMALRSKTNLTETVLGTITNDPTCTNISTSDESHVQCIDIEIDYEVDGIQYQIVMTSSGNHTYVKGEKVTLYYDPENPSTAQLSSDNLHPLGWGLLIIGILILISGWVWYYITRASKYASVVGGASATVGILKGA